MMGRRFAAMSVQPAGNTVKDFNKEEHWEKVICNLRLRPESHSDLFSSLCFCGQNSFTALPAGLGFRRQADLRGGRVSSQKRRMLYGVSAQGRSKLRGAARQAAPTAFC